MIKFAIDDSGRRLPARSQVGVVSADILGEGEKVILSDGNQVVHRRKVPPPVMPDWSKIESIAHYFGREGFAVFPAWLYHPTEPKRIVMNADQAMELGVCYREATMEERGRYNVQHVWDWTAETKWRPTPLVVEKFDPLNPGIGKTLVLARPDARTENNTLLAELIPAVAAAVAKSLQSAEGPQAPPDLDPARWAAFLEFEAWQKAQQAVEGMAAAGGGALTPTGEAERAAWEQRAEAKGIRVDRRWSLERLKAEVEKAV